MANNLIATTILVFTFSILNPGHTTSPIQPELCDSCCQGPSGIPGIPGSSGNNGDHGNNGSPGDRGLTGLQGPSGNNGLPGIDGLKGDNGVVGSPGDKGLTGPQGPSGQIGGPGSVGQPGPVGEKGTKGDAPLNQHSAFTVIKTSSETLSNQAMEFQLVETNIGNHYDPSTHKFTCQIPGTYFFTYTISSDGPTCNPWVKLFKDGTPVVSAFIYDYGSYFLQSTHSVLLQLDTDNQIWLQGSGKVFSNHDKYSSFSGFLLYSQNTS